jgi:hypothetical protein
MEFMTLEVSGRDAVRLLEEYRSTGLYPFLIGDGDELQLLEEQAEDAEVLLSPCLSLAGSLPSTRICGVGYLRL